MRNIVERASILADSEFIGERDFTSSLSQIVTPNVDPAVSHVREIAPLEGGDMLSHLERDHIIDVLARAGGNKAKAARMLGLDRRSLYRRLEAYRIDTGESTREQ